MTTRPRRTPSISIQGEFHRLEDVDPLSFPTLSQLSPPPPPSPTASLAKQPGLLRPHTPPVPPKEPPSLPNGNFDFSHYLPPPPVLTHCPVPGCRLAFDRLPSVTAHLRRDHAGVILSREAADSLDIGRCPHCTGYYRPGALRANGHRCRPRNLHHPLLSSRSLPTTLRTSPSPPHPRTSPGQRVSPRRTPPGCSRHSPSL